MSYYLTIDDAAVDPNPAAPGANYDIAVTIKNTGDTTAERVFVCFQVLNGYSRSIEEDGWNLDLAPGESASKKWTCAAPSTAGNYTVNVFADSTETIAGVSGAGQGDKKGIVLRVEAGA